MKYLCVECNYETVDKSNYNKHIKSKGHRKKLSQIDKSIIINGNKKKLPGVFMCKCKKVFKFASGLSRHKKECNGINVEVQLTTLIEEVKECKTKMANYETQLMAYAKSNNAVTNNNGNTYNISVKNYVQQNYPNAPALEGLPDYAKIKYENDEGIEYSNDDFVDNLIYHYNDNCLHEYLGNFLIKYYKKENPSEQSIWSSDTSRLTYIVKELLINKKSIWNHDYKGLKTKSYIITPLLKRIKVYIDEYWIAHLDRFKTTNVDNLNKFNKSYGVIYKIKKDIDNNVLGNDIVRYLAPHFYMDKKDINGQDMVDYFIDDE